MKELLPEKVNAPVDRLCLIFSGKILKDHETLAKNGIYFGVILIYILFLAITDGLAIHLVIRSAPAGTQQQVNYCKMIIVSRLFLANVDAHCDRKSSTITGTFFCLLLISILNHYYYRIQRQLYSAAAVVVWAVWEIWLRCNNK